MTFDIDMIRKVYERYPERIAAAREAVGKPLTLSEKILYAHLWDGAASPSRIGALTQRKTLPLL